MYPILIKMQNYSQGQCSNRTNTQYSTWTKAGKVLILSLSTSILRTATSCAFSFAISTKRRRSTMERMSLALSCFRRASFSSRSTTWRRSFTATLRRSTSASRSALMRVRHSISDWRLCRSWRGRGGLRKRKFCVTDAKIVSD